MTQTLARGKKRAVLLAAALLALAAARAPRARAESFDSLVAKGRRDLARGRRGQALLELSRALALWRPADGKAPRARVLADKAALENDVGELDRAIADLSAAVRLDKKRPDYFYRLGLLYERESRDVPAVGEFYKAVALNLSYKEAYFARGQAYERLGNRDFARQDYKTSCRLGYRPACDALDAGAPRRRRKKILTAAFARCRAFLKSCAYGGASYSQCVKRAKPCAPDSRGACCPRNCLSLFWGLLPSRSEASAYDAAFGSPRPACAGIP
ncbi:MAG TPA: tetratricopeptide repeat protein [Elusimicrobiota bacterium]|nr:tetratricopeptide repeat protein [Elusimicrobiota bacterium]